MVGPRGLVRGRWYGVGPIARALALYARGATTSALGSAELRHARSQLDRFVFAPKNMPTG